MKIRWLLWGSLVGLVLLLVWSWPSSKPKLIFCDVGQGDGAILTRGNSQILFDLGPENKKMVECLGRYLPFWDKTIEMVVLSHMDSDHSGGLSDLKRYYRVERIFSNEQNNYSIKLSPNDVIRSDWFAFEVLSSGSFDYTQDNDRSVVGVLKVGNKSILMTGDAGVEVEQKLVWRGILVESLKSESQKQENLIDILKVSHHGSSTGTSEELLEAIKPDLAVISVGKNSYGHPTKEVLERLEKYGVEIWRTDVQGSKVFEMD